MSFWLFVKCSASIAVIGVMVFTGMLVYHVTVKPLDGIFERIIPNPAEVLGTQRDMDFAKMLDSAELPDIEPGERAFAKAHELIAMGQLAEAREKLTAIVNVYPTSNSAPIARRIVGEMNLDEILSASFMEGKQTHTVGRGDSYFGIAAKYNTSLDMILHLNGLMEIGNLQPGDELVVMPLEFRILIEPARSALSLWDGGRFIHEYPIVRIGGASGLRNQVTTLGKKSALFENKAVQSQSKHFRQAEKSMQIDKSPLRIRPLPDDEEDDNSAGIFLHPADLEELFLLTRSGNSVEIRNPKSAK